MVAYPGAATALAKVTGVIVTARVGLRAAAECEAPPLRLAQRKLCRCSGVKQEASFMRKIGTSFRKPSRQKPATGY
eukprot:scaffold56052_cov33-Phaeocystis_antarctica.AAC.1